MDGFLQQVAGCLYGEYGDDISSLNIIFPSRRARLFFNESLSGIAGRPLWQPAYLSMDELMEGIAGVAVADRIRLVTELYKVWSRYHEEPFDTFYFWGDMLLSDFDSVDKYMVDAVMLFRNMADLKAVDDLSFLTDEQRETVSRFWGSFGDREHFSEEKQKFLSVWSTLEKIYREYRESLLEAGMAYSGMVYRLAAEKSAAGQTGLDPSMRYAVVGFNALSESEKVVLKHLAAVCHVDFFWDYDDYYIGDRNQEAGLFLSENIRMFPQALPLPQGNDFFTQEKDITVVSAPSDAMQCKYIEEFLSRAASRMGRKPGKETAIVLTDEQLLVPVLHSIPQKVDKINVTMGYPLKLTLAYSFVERLILLQGRKRVRRDGVSFYHEDARGLLDHPYVAGCSGRVAAEISQDVAHRQQIYVDLSGRDVSGYLGRVFSAVGEQWQDLAQYLLDVVSLTAEYGGMYAPDGGGQPCGSSMQTSDSVRYAPATARDEANAEYCQMKEFFALIADNIRKLVNTLGSCGVGVSARIFASLLRKVLQSVRIPYEGEPLEGVQVMGILETRNLDFENVLLLSAVDDNFPGNRAVAASFIPHNLRLAYGLPTPAHHEGVYAYYFYRLLQRASNVEIAYSSRSDEKSSGEQSRYIYQLEYESPHKIARREIGLGVNLAASAPVEVAKDGGVMARLGEYLRPDGKTLSPTSLFNYVQCPLKFYFHSVARLEAGDEIGGEVDAPMFGTILHRAMELLYRPMIGMADPRTSITAMIGSPQVEQAVERAVGEEYFREAGPSSEEWSGGLLMARDIAVRYIDGCILPFDAAHAAFGIVELEKKVYSRVEFTLSDGSTAWMHFGGVSDRVDRLENGALRIVDYKTGADKLEFKGVDALFSPRPADLNSAVLQTMLYSMMFHAETGRDVIPALYYVRSMGSGQYSSMLIDKGMGEPVLSYVAYRGEFEARVREKLSEIFDPRVPFVQCADSKSCRWCDFNVICKR